MRRLAPSIAAFTLVVSAVSFASDAFAHGGGYRGPPGEVPPDSRDPSDPPPPPEGSPPQTPPGSPPGGPSTPSGPTPSGPTTPGEGPGTGGKSGGPPPAGSGNPTGAPKTPGRGPGARKAPGYSSWAFWWAFNKDEILGLKSRVRSRAGTTTQSGFGGKSASAIRAITDEAIANSIVPALRKLLADEK